MSYKYIPGSKSERHAHRMRQMKKSGSSGGFNDFIALAALPLLPVVLPAKLILGKKKRK